MKELARRSVASLHPAAFAAGYVLLSFTNLPTPASGLWRPLAVAMLGAVILSVLLGALTRRQALGAIMASAVVLAVSAWWLLAAVGAIAIAWILLVSVLRRVRHTRPLRWPGWEPANRAVGAFAWTFAIVTGITAAPAILETFQLTLPDRPQSEAPSDAPDVYVLLLDGYPGNDVLREHLGFDNAAFGDRLTDLGFDVSEGSRSNYTATWATLTSMFHGAYLHEIDAITPFATDQTEQLRSLMRSLNQGELLADFRAMGYRLVTVPTPMELATLVTADEVMTGGFMTAFEVSLLQHSQLMGPLLAVAPDFIWDQQRGRIEFAFRTTLEVAGRSRSEPTFMFTHVFDPHPPVVFGPDGESAAPPDCFPDNCTPWEIHEASQWTAFSGQIEHLNSLVVETAESLAALDPEAVIVVMSDHGLQPPGAPEDVKVQNIMAVRSPGQPELLAGGASPVNLLPALLSAYLGEDRPLRDYRGWVSEGEHPLQLTEVTAPSDGQ